MAKKPEVHTVPREDIPDAFPWITPIHPGRGSNVLVPRDPRGGAR